MSERVALDDLTRDGAGVPELDALERVPLWPELPPEALHGLAGRIVAAIAPRSEADPVTILVSVLVAFGNVVGPGPHARVGAERHPCRLNAVIVGDTARARKGTGWAPARELMLRAAPDWAACLKSGASSGEGLIYHVRDPHEEQQPIKDHGRVVGYETVVTDAGVADKRLCAVETEFGGVLRRMKADTNTLSVVLRQAWDTGTLATLTKHSPLRATGAHVSVLGHITQEELRGELADLEAVNGFGNRFLFHLVRRAQLLPDGAAIPDTVLAPLAGELRAALSHAVTVEAMPRDAAAAATWREVYPELAEGTAEGLVGALLSRAEAQVVRLSLVYALLDSSPSVCLPHLTAALALWQHAEASARRIFGGLLGLPLADRVHALLVAKGPLTVTELYRALSRHTTADKLQAALDTLERSGRARRQSVPSKGRPAERWEAIP